MRSLLVAAALAFPLRAFADVSEDIATVGLAGARAGLEAPDRSADDRFALAGVLFLGAIETA